MKSTKLDNTTKTDHTVEQAEFIESTAENLKYRLKAQFKQWGGGLQFRAVMASKSVAAKKVGLTLDALTQILEDEGHIKVFNTPNGARYVFSGDCPLTDEEMQAWLQEQEIEKQNNLEFAKANKN